jgi:hypothetical protein
VDPVGVYDLAQHVDEFPGENYEGTTVRAGAKVLRAIGAIGAYEWAWDAKVLARHVLTVGPVVVGTDWHMGMHVPGTRGLVELDGEYLGGHAWLVDGWDGARQEFRAKNSWGRNWGDRGRFRIALKDMQTLLDADGEACVGVERRIRTF